MIFIFHFLIMGKNNQVTCSNCSKTMWQSNLSKHKCISKRANVLGCPRCGKVVNPLKLRRHQKSIHCQQAQILVNDSDVEIVENNSVIGYNDNEPSSSYTPRILCINLDDNVIYSPDFDVNTTIPTQALYSSSPSITAEIVEGAGQFLQESTILIDYNEEQYGFYSDSITTTEKNVSISSIVPSFQIHNLPSPIMIDLDPSQSEHESINAEQGLSEEVFDDESIETRDSISRENDGPMSNAHSFPLHDPVTSMIIDLDPSDSKDESLGESYRAVENSSECSESLFGARDVDFDHDHDNNNDVSQPVFTPVRELRNAYDGQYSDDRSVLNTYDSIGSGYTYRNEILRNVDDRFEGVSNIFHFQAFLFIGMWTLSLVV